MSFSAFFSCFARIGLLSFGGPAAQIAVMQREIVEERGWMTQEKFLSALSFCMMLPGPEAMQLATYCGWRLRGVLGGVVAGLLFVMPGALVMLGLSAAYMIYGQAPLTEALFLGVKATVIVIVAQALLRLGQKALGRLDRWILALAAFVAITVLGVPFPVIVALAALYGAVFTPLATDLPTAARPKASHLPKTLLTWGSLWAAPLLLLWAMGEDRLLAIGLFFSKLAVVTFGGAYAVLAYMSQEVVERHGWLSTPEMLDGLGLAETTPGPLILVTEFVGFLAAAGPQELLWLGVLGALLTLWVTFIPCFLWIFAGAPYIEWISTRPRISAALSAITAAVVGVIASLSLWFAGHVFFEGSAPNWTALALSAFAALLLIGFKRGVILTLGLTALAGVAIHHIFAFAVF